MCRTGTTNTRNTGCAGYAGQGKATTGGLIRALTEQVNRAVAIAANDWFLLVEGVSAAHP